MYKRTEVQGAQNFYINVCAFRSIVLFIIHLYIYEWKVHNKCIGTTNID